MPKRIKRCDKCGFEDEQKRQKRINGDWLCKKCYKEKRKERQRKIKRNILGITKEQEEKEKEKIKKNYLKDRCKCGSLKQETSEKCIKCYRKDLSKKYVKRKQELEKNQKQTVPSMKGQKEKKVSRQLHFYLTKDEREFLYKKYKEYEKGELQKIIKRDMAFLKNKFEKMKKQKLKDEEINRRFKEEFAKIISQ